MDICRKIVRWSTRSCGLSIDYWVDGGKRGGEEYERKLAVYRAVRALWGKDRQQFAPCTSSSRRNDTFYVPTYLLNMKSNMVQPKLLQRMATQRKSVNDVLSPEVKSALEQHRSGGRGYGSPPIDHERSKQTESFSHESGRYPVYHKERTPFNKYKRHPDSRTQPKPSKTTSDAEGEETNAVYEDVWMGDMIDSSVTESLENKGGADASGQGPSTSSSSTASRAAYDA